MLVFTGAVTSAFAVERVNLHYRIALGVLDKISFRSQWQVYPGLLSLSLRFHRSPHSTTVITCMVNYTGDLSLLLKQ